MVITKLDSVTKSQTISRKVSITVSFFARMFLAITNDDLASSQTQGFIGLFGGG